MSPNPPTGADAAPAVRDLRVETIRPLISPALLADELPLTPDLAQVVADGRERVARALDGRDERLLVVVGPCSIHDPEAALSYARRLRELSDELSDELTIVMRAYFEKPRSTLGWKGLINDPQLDGSYDVNRGLRLARKVLLDITRLGLPVGCEWLDPIGPQYLADVASWGAIGARTVESQVHRQLASGLSMPVGMKNRTDGNVQVAVDGVVAASVPHVFGGVTEHGAPALFGTAGNAYCHVILRGGRAAPNYDAAAVGDALERLAKAGLPRRVVIDASHDNSGKDHTRQPAVAAAVVEQLAAGETGIRGIMLESFLEAGRQDLVPGSEPRFGQSITDACLGWDETADVLRALARA